MLQICLRFQYKINFFLSDVALAAPGPLAYTRIFGVPPKMVFGHNLRYMAPFDFSRAGFCMVFRRASFVFSCPGTDFEAQDRILDLQVNILARGPFWHQKKVPTKLFCGGMISWWGFRGIHPAQINSMVTRSHMGRLLCPKTLLKNKI